MEFEFSFEDEGKSLYSIMNPNANLDEAIEFGQPLESVPNSQIFKPLSPIPPTPQLQEDIARFSPLMEEDEGHAPLKPAFPGPAGNLPPLTEEEKQILFRSRMLQSSRLPFKPQTEQKRNSKPQAAFEGDFVHVLEDSMRFFEGYDGMLVCDISISIDLEQSERTTWQPF